MGLRRRRMLAPPWRACIPIRGDAWEHRVDPHRAAAPEPFVPAEKRVNDGGVCRKYQATRTDPAPFLSGPDDSSNAAHRDGPGQDQGGDREERDGREGG